jgi:hypothetical protein
MYGLSTMRGEIKTRWKELCERTAVEQDPNKRLELIQQINELLSEKQELPEGQKTETIH